VAKAAQVLNIEHLLKRKPKELSGGQRQRVAIGRAIVREPQVFLFDEPLSNLDAKLRGHMRAELALLHERLGKTTVYVTHDQVEAMTLASRIVIFDKGRIQQVGTPSEVFNRPASLFVAGFIGTPTMNFFNVRYRSDGRLQGDGFSVMAPRWLREHRPAAGQELTLGVRPQTLRISAAGPGGEPAAFSVKVDVVEYLGTESQIVGHLATPGGQRVSSIVPGDGHALLHSLVGLDVDPETLHVFDSASGRSLRP
jgi:ABC-type sugar transport system ATPase subunit